MDNTAIISYLLANNADVSLKNAQSETALHTAVRFNSVAAAFLLASEDGIIFFRDANGKTPIENALANGGHEFFPALFNQKTALIQDAHGQSVVHHVVAAKSTAALAYCIENNIPLSHPDNFGRTPLHLALDGTHEAVNIDMAASLILGGASPVRGEYSYFEDAVKTRNPSLRFDDGQTPLHFAATQGEEEIAAYLLEHGASPETKDISGSTPLHEAVRYGNLDVARGLLEHNANPNARDELGKTPLLAVIPHNVQREIYDALILSGALVNAKDIYGDTVLHIAAMSGAEIEIFSRLSGYAGVDINERNKNGNTPLALAVEYKNAPVISFLVQRGGDIFAADVDGKTPLIKALDSGSELVSLLVTDANKSFRDSEGNTALHIAVLNATTESLRRLPNSPYAKDSTLEEIKLLVEKGIDINSRNKAGDTPLSIAVQKNFSSAGEFFLAKGADVFSSNSKNMPPLRIALEAPEGPREWILTSEVIVAADGSGNTALHHSAEWGSTRAVQLLLEKGADVNAANANAQTAIFKAAQANNSEIISLLMAGGAKIDTRDFLGNTPLHSSVRWDAHEAARSLIAHGAGLDAKNIAGKTPLGDAARAGKISMVSLLLDAGSDINASDSTGKTILIDAIQSGSEDEVRLLLNRGASPLIQEMYGRTAYHEAVAKGNITIIALVGNAGGNPLARDANGETPLSASFNKGQAVVNSVLGSNLNLVDSDGNTPVHIAVLHGAESETVSLLVSKGYNLNRRNSDGTTPLMLAVRRNQIDTMRILLMNGADPYIYDNSGECPVSLALNGSLPILTDIAKTMPQKTDISGDGILHYAAKASGSETIKRLLSMGLDKTARNISGELPYDVAARWKNTAAADLLK
jgi:ankyrin repeat protein